MNALPDLVGGRGVVRIDAGRCAEEDRGVGHVAGHRAGRVLVGADRDDACAAPQPERRLDPDDAVRAGRADDRAVRLRADGCDREVRCRDDARAGARAARVAVEDVRHVRLAADAAPAARRGAGPEVGPLGQVGLAEDDRAGRLQPRHDERVIGRAPRERPGAGRRRHAGGVDVVLDDDRHPEQRAPVALASRAVGRPCVGEGRRADRDHRFERRVELADAPEIEVRQLDGVQPTRVHQRLEFGDRRLRRRRCRRPWSLGGAAPAPETAEHEGQQGRENEGTAKSAAHRVTSTGLGPLSMRRRPPCGALACSPTLTGPGLGSQGGGTCFQAGFWKHLRARQNRMAARLSGEAPTGIEPV